MIQIKRVWDARINDAGDFLYLVVRYDSKKNCQFVFWSIDACIGQINV